MRDVITPPNMMPPALYLRRDLKDLKGGFIIWGALSLGKKIMFFLAKYPRNPKFSSGLRAQHENTSNFLLF